MRLLPSVRPATQRGAGCVLTGLKIHVVPAASASQFTWQLQLSDEGRMLRWWPPASRATHTCGLPAHISGF